jgi:endonuclease/exonuclease/phosphatase family metal-dependent hydrolase
MPIWLWGACGLLLASNAFYFLRAPLSLIMTAVWSITLLVGADEARVLGNLAKSPPLPGKAANHEGKPVIRVLTLNCAFFTVGNPSLDIARWQPDIVLLQDVAPHQVRQIADMLYSGLGDYRVHLSNGIVTRWKIDREVRNASQRDEQLTIVHPVAGELEVVNVHLQTAATDLRLWEREAWTKHRQNRSVRNNELATTLRILMQTRTAPATPVLCGGDFNAPATDIIHQQLTPDFENAFAVAGKGWGDTFHRRFPILRIDHIYATRHFTPVRCCAVTTRNSDHRMVVADLILR